LAGTLCIELRGIAFPLGVLRESETGDVLILGERTSRWRDLHISLVGARGTQRLRTWNASYDGTQLTISPDAPNPTLELIMSDPKPAAAADNIPVSLDFELGNLAVPLGELATLRPGYVFELPGNLDAVRVVIRANGTRVGHGELVAVGDVLGVQLLAFETDGLR
jgi:type III secretion protein Q